MTLLDKGQKAVLLACLYLAALFVSCIVMWWFVLFGGNPYTVSGQSVMDDRGLETLQFEPGDRVAIRWDICSNGRPSGIDYKPALTSADGVQYHLPNGVMQTRSGCFQSTHGFVVPHLPEGQYTYQASIVFQNNLVGRDQSFQLPSVTIEVLP